MAIRCLMQLAIEHQGTHLIAAEVVKRSFYVDDVLTDADTVEGVVEVVQQLQDLLGRGCFSLSKWAVNSDSLRAHIWFVDDLVPVTLGEDTTALGIQWDPTHDTFSVRVPPVPERSPFTKTSMLSYIASQFDPLGFFAPTTLRGKLIMQDLWRSNLGWQTPVPDLTASNFRAYCADIQKLVSFRIPRWMGQHRGDDTYYFGFTDASERGYAASVFVRVRGRQGYQVRLVYTHHISCKVANALPTKMFKHCASSRTVILRFSRTTTAAVFHKTSLRAILGHSFCGLSITLSRPSQNTLYQQ